MGFSWAGWRMNLMIKKRILSMFGMQPQQNIDRSYDFMKKILTSV